MKSKKMLKNFIFIILGILIMTTTVKINTIYPLREIDEDYQILNISKVSGKIHIKNNWSDAKIDGLCTGDGTLSNPYLIEDLVIDAGSDGSCIFIENSFEHFIVLNCTLNNAEDNPSLNEAGIKLSNSSNGQLINNTISNLDGLGILLNISDDTLLFGNSINSNHGSGLRIINCSNILAYFNNIQSQFYNLFLENSTFRFFSEKRISYFYNGTKFTNYLGNYWSDYPDGDNNNDGIGDEHYVYTDGFEHHIDLYPLIDHIENYQIIGFTEAENIPGYNLLFIIGILSLVTIIGIKRIEKYL